MLTFKMLRQQHILSTDEWMSLRNSPMFCGRKYMAPMVWGFGGIWTSNRMTNALPFEIWTIKTRCFLHHVFKTDCGEIFMVFICTVNIQNDTCGLAMAFYFWLMMNGWSLEIVKKNCDKKMSYSGGFQPRTFGFMSNALPFEVDSDLSLCQTE